MPNENPTTIDMEKMALPAQAIEPKRSPHYRSLYANNTSVGVSTFDFSLVFGEIVGATEGKLQVEEHTKIIMSPLHAKVLAQVFMDNVAAYEKQFGEIKLPVPPTIISQKE
jgi:hypothetical protein